MRPFVLAGLVAVFALESPPAGATGWCDPFLGWMAWEIPAASETFYLIVTPDMETPLVYQETNGIFVGGDLDADLQRGDDLSATSLRNDPCGVRGVPHDTLLL